MRISDWSSDVCSSDLLRGHVPVFLLKPTETFEQIVIAESASQFGPSAGDRFARGFAGPFGLPSLVTHSLQFCAAVWDPRKSICLGQLAKMPLENAAAGNVGTFVKDRKNPRLNSSH